jgi:hypothetical protein
MGDNGNIISLAGYANDGGQLYSNSKFVRDATTLKVYLEAICTIEAGDEILCCYGPNYWGLEKYPERWNSLSHPSTSDDTNNKKVRPAKRQKKQ